MFTDVSFMTGRYAYGLYNDSIEYFIQIPECFEDKYTSENSITLAYHNFNTIQVRYHLCKPPSFIRQLYITVDITPCFAAILKH